MDEFKSLDKLDEIRGILDEIGAKYEVHSHDDGEFSYLVDDEICIKIPNPYSERTMFIDLQDEISLFFGPEWHEHYYLTEEYFEDFRDTLTSILKNECCSHALFYGDDLQWGGSGLAVKGNEIKELSGYYCINTMSNEISEYKKEWADNDMYSELRFMFWNPIDDKTVVFEKDPYGLTDEVLDILTEIDDLLEKLGCEFDIHRDSDEQFPDYTENDGCVIVFNPYTDRNLTVEIAKSEHLSEMTLYFAEQHCHFGFDELPDLLNTVRAIVENEIGDGEVYLGDERRHSIGANVYRADVESKSPAECFGSVLSGYVDEQCKDNGAEVHFRFWNPKDDKTVVIERKVK